MRVVPPSDDPGLVVDATGRGRLDLGRVPMYDLTVEWIDSQDMRGSWVGDERLYLNRSYRDAWMRGDTANIVRGQSVLWHEVGHAIETTLMDWEQRRRIMDLWGWQTSWESGPYAEQGREAFGHAFPVMFGPPDVADHDRPYVASWGQGIPLDTLGQVADIVRELLEDPMPTFTDVPADHPHADGIVWAAEQGLVAGYDDGTFRPSEPVTRGQLATILRRLKETS